MPKKIGILTSGGDCAGLNAVIRAVTLRSVNKYGWKVYGIKDGTLGLMTNPLNVIELKPSDFDGHLMRMGGTFLGANNKGNPFSSIQKNGVRLDLSNQIILLFISLPVASYRNLLPCLGFLDLLNLLTGPLTTSNPLV